MEGQVCKFYGSRTGCRFGDKCRSVHVAVVAREDANAPCKFFLSPGGCRAGKDCMYMHGGKAQEGPNAEGPLPRVWCKNDRAIPPTAVYVGRPSPFGNPFKMQSEKDRDEVCNQFEAWILAPAQAKLLAQVRKELKGKHLICFCAPHRCHADTLLRLANDNTL